MSSRVEVVEDRSPDLVAKIQVALRTWQTRLLDLTKRNRALNFKATKVSTVTIVDEQPVEVYRHLVVNGRAMRFKPTLEPAPARPRTPTTEIDDDDAAPQPAERDFAPYEADSLDERHTDDVLQSLATPEALDKSLRRLDEQARSTIEEQGVNVLFLALGMLHYSESADSDEVFRAPLIMVPVTLERRSARTGYAVRMTDDESMVNPALAEHLRRSFGIELPSLPALAEDDTDEAPIQSFYEEVADIAAERARAGFQGWAVKTDIFLGIFSFQKLVMFKDLEANADPFGAHAMIEQLITRQSAPGTPVMGLPADVRDIDLDRDFAPECTAQIVDADSSQLRAIAAVSKGHALVLEGPPGTGKSQTITNLIAQALSEGKSVLFVAEKMAALQVVHSRLVNAGLGEFCLELHASKANKRAVMQELKSALDASLQRPSTDSEAQRLPAVRASLTEYVDAVHARAEPLGISPYQATGMLDAVLDAPRYSTKSPPKTVTREGLGNAERMLTDLAKAAEHVGVPSEHPWRDSARTLYLPRALDELRTTLVAVAEQVRRVSEISQAVGRALKLTVASLDDAAVAVEIVRVFRESPGAPPAVLDGSAWNESLAASIIESGRKLERWRADIDRKFTESALDQEHASDIAHVEQKSSGIFAFLAVFDGRWRAIKQRWLSYRKPGYAPSLVAQATDLKLVDQYTKARSALEARGSEARALFGNLWGGDRSDWTALERYVAWVRDVRALAERYGLSNETLAVATKPKPDIPQAAELERALPDANASLESLRRTVEWPDGYLASTAMPGVVERLNAMSAHIDDAPHWATFEQLRQQAAASAAGELVEIAMRNDAPFAMLPRMFRRAVLEHFLEDVIGARPALRNFRTLSHEQRLAEFRALDERVLKENRAAVVARLREATQQRLQEPASRAGLPFVQREMAKQRNIAPLRRTLAQAEATVRAIKPCFLMSPLTVAQYLDGRAPTFDLVIFDEASQLPPEDAVGAIARGRQLVVVGDPKQLPPTNFFTSAEVAAAPLGDDGSPIVDDAESVLEDYMGAGVPVTRLKWHYRSAHESLITFSNVSFYDADLYTFPSVETSSDEIGLSFEHVPDGVYEGKGLNMAEARRVVDAVVRHAKERPHESLGVGTFNMRQQLAILDELELRRREDPSIEAFFARGAHEPFFVKNLENIQGDERDVIFLSVTYAKGPDGRLRYNFGPINGQNGWRRLNVLTTRARRRMRVFSSMRADDINAAATGSSGPRLLQDFLRYAETGRLESVVASATAAAESSFERQVASELARRGIKVVPQVGVAGYRIDIGVLDDEVPGRYVCGIECDGVAYHSAETARDRDRLRQQVLEGRGWTIVRVWSTDWFKDRPGQIERLLRLIAQAKADVQAGIERDHRERRDTATENHRTAARQNASADYVRPIAEAYRFAGGAGQYAGSEFLEAPSVRVTSAIVDVVNAESPVHIDDLTTRVAGMWSVGRVGSRIGARVVQELARAVKAGDVVLRGEFAWTPAMARGEVEVPVRSRAGTRISGERVAVEEIRAAIQRVLEGCRGLTHDELLSETRQMLGVGKGSVAPTFETTLQQMVQQGQIGEGSAGYAIRV